MFWLEAHQDAPEPKSLVEKATDYLRHSVDRPDAICVEEVSENRVVLSYIDEGVVVYKFRRFKEFKFEKGEVVSMTNFDPNASLAVAQARTDAINDAINVIMDVLLDMGERIKIVRQLEALKK